MKMNRWIRQERGAALIAALMLTLVLSALGFVAVKTTTRSLAQTGNYVTRSQAGIASESALAFVGDRVGLKSTQYWDYMQKRFELEQGTANNQKDLLTRGAFMVVTRDQFVGTNGSLKTPDAASPETGLFSTDDATQVSHESSSKTQAAEFRVVLRDPIEGPPVAGMQQNATPGGGRLCQKKIAMISEHRYNATDTSDQNTLGTNQADVNSWVRPSTAGIGRNYQETIIGPVLCE